MNIKRLFSRMFAAGAPASAPARYEYLGVPASKGVDNNKASLGFADERANLPPIESHQPAVPGIIRVHGLEFIGALFQSEAAEAEAKYEAFKRGIRSRRPESNADSLR
jgi:hypothetical protein